MYVFTVYLQLLSYKNKYGTGQSLLQNQIKT